MGMKYEETMKTLKSLSNPRNVEGMARFGINPRNTLGVPMPQLQDMARMIGKDHRLAGRLWDSGTHEARILASLIDDPDLVTEKQMDSWAKDFDSWDVCDQCCMNLFDKTPFAYMKAEEWSGRDEEFVRRAGFTMMASLAVHDKRAKDESFERFLPLIRKGAKDDRNFVKKAVNWALRQIGKRSMGLNKKAIKASEEILKAGSKTARWIANDALRELKSDVVQERLRRK